MDERRTLTHAKPVSYRLVWPPRLSVNVCSSGTRSSAMNIEYAGGREPDKAAEGLGNKSERSGIQRPDGRY